VGRHVIPTVRKGIMTGKKKKTGRNLDSKINEIGSWQIEGRNWEVKKEEVSSCV
jgi:hypothetical protein